MEALAMGIPVLAYAYHGPKDFLEQGHGAVLEPKEFEKIDDPIYYYHSDYGNWIRPNRPQIAKGMRMLYERKEDFKANKEKISKGIHEKWSWDNAAKIALKHLEEL